MAGPAAAKKPPPSALPEAARCAVRSRSGRQEGAALTSAPRHGEQEKPIYQRPDWKIVQDNLEADDRARRWGADLDRHCKDRDDRFRNAQQPSAPEAITALPPVGDPGTIILGAIAILACLISSCRSHPPTPAVVNKKSPAAHHGPKHAGHRAQKHLHPNQPKALHPKK